MSQEDIDCILNENIYNYEKNKFGHVILVMKDIVSVKLKNSNVNLFIDKISKEVINSIEISKKHGNSTIYIHTYLENCLLRNLPIMVFRKMNSVLSERFTDVVEGIFVYSNSKFIGRLWPIIKLIVDPETRGKVKILNTSS
tara:strand:+ start:109 stop:531 length:423 start_codon:yes stop_codon:yes gene_type:complete